MGAGLRRAVNATRGLGPLPLKPFAEGRRWRVKLTDENRGRHGYPFDFVILGPTPNSRGKMDGKWKRCRLEFYDHDAKCGREACHHGIENIYPVTQLKKYAELVPLSSEGGS